MDSNAPLGLIELVIVLAFVLGWGVLELVSLRDDKKKKADKAAKVMSEREKDAAK